MEKTYISKESIKEQFEFDYIRMIHKDKSVAVLGISENGETVTTMTLQLCNKGSIREVIHNGYMFTTYAGKLESYSTKANRLDLADLRFAALLGKYIEKG